MAKAKKKKPKIKTLGLGDPRIIEFVRELTGGSARAAVIIGHTYLHGSLQRLLKKRLVHDDNLFNEIDNLFFTKCADLCYLTGSISRKEREELYKINEVRNAFAHEISLYGFENADVAEKCENLELCESLALSFGYGFTLPRDRYVSTIMCFIFILGTREDQTDRIEENKAFSIDRSK